MRAFPILPQIPTMKKKKIAVELRNSGKGELEEKGKRAVGNLHSQLPSNNTPLPPWKIPLGYV